MTRHVKPGLSGKDAPSLTVIQGIWYRLISLLEFRHRDLRDNYKPTDAKHISVHLDQLVKRQLLVKGRWHKKKWLGFLVLEKLACIWIEKGLSAGCLSWDRVILKLLGIILQSSLSARCGDVARSKLYTGMECLCYGDVELTLAPQREQEPLSVQHLSAKFTLRYRKGRKDVRNDDDIVFLEPLEKESQNVVCAVKLLVILALRFGNVHGTTLQEVLVHTSKRVDRTVQWTHPNRPVLCQMPRGNSMLTLDTPAPSTQLGRSLKEMALVGGVIDPVTSHDIRRGAMRDTAHLNRTVAGVESACAALVGGHTKMSENRGITRAYIGALQAPIYNIRAEKPFVDRLAPKATESTFTPRRNTTAEIDAYMDDHGMDKKDSMKRSTASYQLREAQVRKWRESQQDRQVLAPESKNSPTIANKAAAGKGRTLLPVSTNIGRVVTHAMEKPFPEQPRLPEKQETQKYFSNEVPIDPRLLNWDDNDADVEPAALDALESLIFSNLDEDRATSDKDNGLESTPEHHTTDAIEDCLIDAHLQERTPQAETDLSFWNCQADLFVNRLAAINIFKLSSSFKQNDPLEAAKRVASGNSRDHPTPFLIYCGVGECDYSSWSLAAVEKHQINCTGAQPSEKYFSCIEDGCSLSFTTPGSLKSHINTAHTFTPRPCARCPDQPDVLYQDIKSWKRHQAELHDKFDEPVYCPLKDHGCNNKQTAYTGFSAIKNHLQNVHKQNAEQIRAFFPAKQPVRLPEATFDCPLPVCTENLNVNCNRDLRLHLKRKHGQTDEQTLELVPLSKAEKSKQLNRAAKADEPKIAKTVWECPDDDCSSTRAFPANRRQKIGR